MHIIVKAYDHGPVLGRKKLDKRSCRFLDLAEHWLGTEAGVDQQSDRKRFFDRSKELDRLLFAVLQNDEIRCRKVRHVAGISIGNHDRYADESGVDCDRISAVDRLRQYSWQAYQQRKQKN